MAWTEQNKLFHVGLGFRVGFGGCPKYMINQYWQHARIFPEHVTRMSLAVLLGTSPMERVSLPAACATPDTLLQDMSVFCMHPKSKPFCGHPCLSLHAVSISSPQSFGRCIPWPPCSACLHFPERLVVSLGDFVPRRGRGGGQLNPVLGA